jgi:C-terminal processing protease CtpA/Prc
MQKLLVLAAMVGGGAAGCGHHDAPPPSITGIGISIRKDGDRLKVMGVGPGTPAAQAGLHQGLLIQEIEGTNVADLPLRECADMMRGPVGSKVRLEVVDSDNQTTNLVEFTREKIALPAGQGARTPPGAP